MIRYFAEWWNKKDEQLDEEFREGKIKPIVRGAKAFMLGFVDGFVTLSCIVGAVVIVKAWCNDIKAIFKK